MSHIILMHVFFLAWQVQVSKNASLGCICHFSVMMLSVLMTTYVDFADADCLREEASV